MGAVEFQPGSLVTRAERQKLYGGGIQRGIEASTTTQNVFVYSDPKEGEKFGYSYDGWAVDGATFLYTGEGTRGDQQLTGGNRAILEHREHGRSLHLFVAETGKQRGGKQHRYIGEFEIGTDPPFTREDAVDAEGEMRQVIVFRLQPMGATHREKDHGSHFPDAATTSHSERIPIERRITDVFEQPPTEGRIAQRTESELSDRYRRYLEDAGCAVSRYRLRPAGEVISLLTDLHDDTCGDLYEVKGTTTRESIRTAIGQLLDYRRHINNHQHGQEVVLVPSQPSPDLVDLIHSCGMTCVYENKGTFISLSPGASHFRH